ncbi:MAG: hypothetical protein EAZ81_05870 [Verrucomicrobia bacterium]|nr:MAG: hypothetical protein EAZ81_05870 [Verrucomicrobiota bacterium]
MTEMQRLASREQAFEIFKKCRSFWLLKDPVLRSTKVDEFRWFRRVSSWILLSFVGDWGNVRAMKIVFLLFLLMIPAIAQTKRNERKSLLDNDPRVVYLTEMPDKQIELMIVKEAPVFSDPDGKQRLGVIVANQKVKIEAITDKAYKVRGQGTRHGIAGWVGPWAFESKDPNFVENLKNFYQRQLAVNELIAEKEIAMGMSMVEVEKSIGKPTKSTVRQTPQGQTGSWEFIDYEDERQYATRIDPQTGQAYRQLIGITQIEKSKRVIEFTNGIVSAIEDAKNRRRDQVRIVVPPVVFGW